MSQFAIAFRHPTPLFFEFQEGLGLCKTEQRPFGHHPRMLIENLP
jgi:hypothetical protein